MLNVLRGRLLRLASAEERERFALVQLRTLDEALLCIEHAADGLDTTTTTNLRRSSKSCFTCAPLGAAFRSAGASAPPPPTKQEARRSALQACPRRARQRDRRLS